MLFFYLLLELLDGGAVWGGAVGLEDLDILICEWRNLLLLNLIVGKVLLVLLPILTCSGRLGLLASCTASADKDGAYHGDGRLGSKSQGLK